ncbi:MAG: hypothetical protein ACXW0Z_05550 [Gemmatirosa sp.]
MRLAREGRVCIVVSAPLALVALSLAAQRGGAWRAASRAERPLVAR